MLHQLWQFGFSTLCTFTTELHLSCREHAPPLPHLLYLCPSISQTPFLSHSPSLSLKPPHTTPTNPSPKPSQSQCTTSTTLLLSSPNCNDASRNFDCGVGKFRETTTTPETTSVTDENGNGGGGNNGGGAAAAAAAASASPCASPVTPSPRPPFVLQLGRGVSAFMV